jgi:hypothetical protein
MVSQTSDARATEKPSIDGREQEPPPHGFSVLLHPPIEAWFGRGANSTIKGSIVGSLQESKLPSDEFLRIYGRPFLPAGVNRTPLGNSRILRGRAENWLSPKTFSRIKNTFFGILISESRRVSLPRSRQRKKLWHKRNVSNAPTPVSCQ